jgi:hypothetical protein
MASLNKSQTNKIARFLFQRFSRTLGSPILFIVARAAFLDLLHLVGVPIMFSKDSSPRIVKAKLLFLLEVYFYNYDILVLSLGIATRLPAGPARN